MSWRVEGALWTNVRILAWSLRRSRRDAQRFCGEAAMQMGDGLSGLQCRGDAGRGVELSMLKEIRAVQG